MQWNGWPEFATVASHKPSQDSSQKLKSTLPRSKNEKMVPYSQTFKISRTQPGFLVDMHISFPTYISQTGLRMLWKSVLNSIFPETRAGKH